MYSLVVGLSYKALPTQVGRYIVSYFVGVCGCFSVYQEKRDGELPDTQSGGS